MSTSHSTLYSIIEELSQAKIAHTLAITRQDAITILVVVPGERWEIDVYVDGEVNVEVFRSSGEIQSTEELRLMIAAFSD